MRTILLITLAVILIGISLTNAPRSTAVNVTLTPTTYPIKDQDTCQDSPLGSASISGLIWKAQTFVAGVSGKLVRVNIPGVNNIGTTTLHIRSTTNGQPSGSDLGSATISCGTVFDFGTGIPLVAGQLYSLVLSNNEGIYAWHYSNSSTCYSNPQGQPFTSIDGGMTWGGDIVDFYFTTYMVPDIPTGIPVTLPEVCIPQPLPPALTHPKVFVVAFPVTNVVPIASPQLMTNQIITKLKEGSMYHGYANPNAQPYFEFQIYGGNVIWHPSLPPKQPNNIDYDYAAVYSYYNLCNLIQNGEIDEVWFWDGGQGGFTEAVTTGPEGTWSTGGQVNPPNCGKQVTTMTFNYTRDINVHMEAYTHRLEGLFMHYFPCDFWTETWPWKWWPPQCAGLVSDLYGYVARPFSGNNHVGGCGDAHAPPNILDDHAYDYSNHTVVQSICEDWQQDGTATVKSFDCQEWKCNQAEYHVWWMQNIPGLNNTNRNRNSNLHPNWWTYLFGKPVFRTYLPLILRVFPDGFLFQVFADQGWQDSTITLAQGQYFQVEYISGQWTDYSGGAAPFGPEGSNYICSAVNCCEPLPAVSKGALIGKVGNEIFLIGSGGVFVAGANGNLLVRMNDCDNALADNAGSLNIKVTR